MPSFPVQVVVDPTNAEAGVKAVESGLNRVETRATGVRAAMQRAFDFNAGPAVQTTSAVDKALDGVTSSANATAASVKGVSDSFKILSAPSIAAANNLKQINENLVRLGLTSQTIPATNQRIINSNGQVRASQISLGQQFNDFSTQVLSGGSVITAFAQQSGQAAFALSGFNGILGTVGRFLAGPWGTILIIAATVLGGLVAKLISGNNELDEAIKKLKEDARETELNRKAKEAFNKTLEGQIALQRELNKELDRSILTQRQLQQGTLLQVQTNVANLQGQRPGLASQITAQEKLVAGYRDQIMNPGFGTDPEAMLGIVAAAGAAETKLKGLKDQLAELDKQIANGTRAVREAQQPLIQRDVEASLDARTRATEDYTKALGRLNQQLAIGAGRSATRQFYNQDGTFTKGNLNGISQQQYAAELRRITKQRDDAIEAAAKADRAQNAGDGVSRFRSAKQAIGIAGRELQSQGLRVSENEQFGGVTSGVHVGAGHRNGTAIDVNVGRGVTEANIPDQRKRFDDLALRYQARGYTVLWNGKVYGANGTGPTGTISGADKHFDHMHVEAPSSIVGKATNTSGETQAVSEYKAAQAKAEQERDFVSGVVDNANARGRNENRATALSANIDKTLDEFNRRFNRPANDNEKGAITKALTDADAREIAQNFKTAYVDPLERLQALQGKTGLDRQVLNAQLSETTRLGRELTPVEAAQIENGIRKGDALTREAQILEQIKAPLEDYKNTLSTLNDLLARSEINQTQFNSRVADLGATARGIVSSLPGVDPKTGQSYADIGAKADEDARYAKELEALQNNRAQILQMGVDFDALEEAARKKHVDTLNKIDDARKITALQGAQSIGESLLQITEDSVGKQNAVYKALFVATKAFAIAEAIINIQRGVSQALALPFPANIPAIASVVAAAASIVSNIQSVSLNLADGGYVTGPGGSRSDSVRANLSNGEFVVNAEATRSNRALLEAVNSGRPVRAAREQAAMNDNASSGRPLNLRIDGSNAPGVDWEVNQVTEDDVEVIAKRVGAREFGKNFSGQMRDPNSKVSKGLTRTTSARRKRA